MLSIWWRWRCLGSDCWSRHRTIGATGQSFSIEASTPSFHDDMLSKTMSKVSQRFPRIPTSRKKVVYNIFDIPENAVVRSGPFVIPKLGHTQLRSSEYKNNSPDVEQISKFLNLLSIKGTTVTAIRNFIPDYHSSNQCAPKNFGSWPSNVHVTPKEKLKTISFYIKDFKNFRASQDEDMINEQHKKYKSVDGMYKALRAQILNYIKSKDGLVKRDSGIIHYENGMRDLGKMDVPFQRILDGAEDVLNTIVFSNLKKNLTKLDAEQEASLAEDSKLHTKVAHERSATGYNETYNDEAEEESPETQELVESLNHLPYGGDGFYGHSIPPSTDNAEAKTHRFIDANRRFTKDREDRIWAPRKKSNTLLSENLIEKVTEVNYDPEDIGDQELSDVEVTESADDAQSSSETIRSGSNLQDSKAVDKMGQDDESLNKKIDQRICNALEILRSALMCGFSVGESVSVSTLYTSSPEMPRETFTQDVMGGSNDQPVEEDLTCIDTTCPTSSSKMTTKEHTSGTNKLVTKKTSTSSSIRKSVKPLAENSPSKSTKDIRKLNPTKSTVSKRTTSQKESNRRNVLRFHLSQKRLRKPGLLDQKDGLSDYEKVFGTKNPRLLVPLKGIKSKYTKMSNMNKTNSSKS